jgi:hypothetical protein
MLALTFCFICSIDMGVCGILICSLPTDVCFSLLDFHVLPAVQYNETGILLSDGVPCHTESVPAVSLVSDNWDAVADESW